MDHTNIVAQYLIEIKADDEKDFSLFGRVDGRRLQYTCEYLRRGKRYTFRVKGKNAAGVSEIPAVWDTPVALKDGIGWFLELK